MKGISNIQIQQKSITATTNYGGKALTVCHRWTKRRGTRWIITLDGKTYKEEDRTEIIKFFEKRLPSLPTK